MSLPISRHVTDRSVENWESQVTCSFRILQLCPQDLDEKLLGDKSSRFDSPLPYACSKAPSLIPYKMDQNRIAGWSGWYHAMSSPVHPSALGFSPGGTKDSEEGLFIRLLLMIGSWHFLCKMVECVRTWKMWSNAAVLLGVCVRASWLELRGALDCQTARKGANRPTQMQAGTSFSAVFRVVWFNQFDPWLDSRRCFLSVWMVIFMIGNWCHSIMLCIQGDFCQFHPDNVLLPRPDHCHSLQVPLLWYLVITTSPAKKNKACYRQMRWLQSGHWFQTILLTARSWKDNEGFQLRSWSMSTSTSRLQKAAVADFKILQDTSSRMYYAAFDVLDSRCSLSLTSQHDLWRNIGWVCTMETSRPVQTFNKTAELQTYTSHIRQHLIQLCYNMFICCILHIWSTV